MPSGTAPITFIVPGQDDTIGEATRGAATIQVAHDLPRGRLKHSVRIAAARSGGAVARLDAMPGDDVVVLRIANGPALVLHPEHARDLMLAQQSESKSRREARGEPAEPNVVAVPAQLRWRGMEQALPSRSASRGLFGDVALAAFEVITGVAKDEGADLAASGVVKLVDGQVDPGVYALNAERLDKLKGGAAPLQSIDGADGGPLLVLMHGTFSSTFRTFGKLWTQHSQYVRELFDHYRNRVYALDHPTLGASPIENALTLVRAMPDGARLHLLTHSRGGLVAETLARVCGNPRLVNEDFAGFGTAGYQQQLAHLKELAALVAKKDIRVDRVVRVACPSRGTLLASKRLDAYVSMLKWTLELASVPVAPELIEFLGHVAQKRADPNLIPGLAAQIPGNPFLDWLHAAEDAVPGELRVVSGDIESDSVISWLKTLAADAFYWTDNDLVVQTRSMYGGAARAAGATFLYDRGGKVSHFNYFSNPRTAEAITSALIQTDPPGFRTIGPLSWRGESSTGVRAALRSAQESAPPGSKPAVFVLPGILGSNLKLDGKRVWLDRRFVNGLKKLQYKEGVQDGVEPDGALDGVYDALELYLADTHEVKEFAYDWRKPIEEEARRLATEVETALRAREATGQPVHLLAHSMGGLVARTMHLERPEVWRQLMSRPGARFVMLGTPNQGSWAPMQLLSGDDDFGNLLVALGALFQDSKARSIIAQFPGFIQLQAALLNERLGLDKAQTWQELAKSDMAAVRDYNFWHTEDQLIAYEWGVPSDAVLNRAVALRRRLEAEAEELAAYADRVSLVVGRARFTPDGYELAQSGLYYLDAEDGGDGRVTLANARLPGIRTWQVDCSHGDLPGKQAAFKGYLDLLLNGTTQEPVLRRLPDVTRGADASTTAQHVRSRPSRERLFARPPETPRDVLSAGAEVTASMHAPPRPPLAITVANGDLTFVRLPLMLGHYESLRLTGTEYVMDRLVGSTMSQSLAMGHYPTRTGEHHVFLNTNVNRENPWHVPRPEAVIVVGLGPEGKLRVSDLQATIVRGAIAWSQRIKEKPDARGRFELTATLIGSGGIGISVADAAQALARGITEANERLAERKWPQVAHLHIIDLYLDRATEAWRALQVESTAKPGCFAVSENIETGTGGLKRPLESGYRGAPYDFVRALSEPTSSRTETVVSYTLDTHRARSEVRAQRAQGPLLRELLTKASNTVNDNSRIGRTLYQLLVPLEMRSFLSGTSEMQLELDSQTASIPWELLETSAGTASGSTQEQPWAIRTKLLRKLRTAQYRTEINDAGADASVLVIGEPLADPARYPRLVGAREEARAVADRLGPLIMSNVNSVMKVISSDAGPGPDACEVINALLARDWRVVHIAGHGEPPLGKDPRGVVLSNEAFLGPREIANMDPVPALVFVNCCHLAAFSTEQLLRRSARADYDRARFAAGVAQKLIEIGVRCVVAAGWAVADDSAKVFATTFYDALLAGRRFIDAVAAARQAAWKPNDNTWAAYQCYGDPDWRLTRGVGDAQRPNRPMGDEFATVASADALILALETIAVRSKYGKPELPDDHDDDAIDASTRERQEQRAEGLRLEQQRSRIRHLEARFEGVWGAIGAIAEAFAAAWAASGDRAAAIKWYERAVAAPDATASLKATEQLANLRVREAWSEVDGTAPANRTPEVIDKARRAVASSMKVLEVMSATQPSMERISLVGSAYKRLAMLDAEANRDDEPAIRKMKDYYDTAEELGRDAALADAFYPALNSIVAQVALNAKRNGPAELDPNVGDRARKSIAAKVLDDPDFWSVAAQTELAMYIALEKRVLATQRAALENEFDNLYARMSSPTSWASVYDNARFVLGRYSRYTQDAAEKAAAAALLARLKRFSARE